MNFKWRIFKHGWPEFCQWMANYWRSRGDNRCARGWIRAMKRDSDRTDEYNGHGQLGSTIWTMIMGEETEGHFVILQ